MAIIFQAGRKTGRSADVPIYPAGIVKWSRSDFLWGSAPSGTYLGFR